MIYKGQTKQYECGDLVYLLPVNHCVFCKHCNDVIYDYMNGPYMFFCDLEKEPTITTKSCFCDSFVHNGYEFDEKDYKERMRTMKENADQLHKMFDNNPEFKKAMKEVMMDVFNKFLNGEEEIKNV